MWVRSRPPATPVKIEGTAAELWVGDAQVAVLLGWRLAGADGKWTASAKKCRLSAALAGELEVRFFWGQVELRGRGYALDDTGLELEGTTLVVKGASYGT